MQTCVCVYIYSLLVLLGCHAFNHLHFCLYIYRVAQKTSRVTTNTSENTDTIEKLVLSHEDAPAPETRRTMYHFEHKNYIIVNLILPYWKLLFFIYLYFRNCAANFVEICNIFMPIGN